MHDTVSSVGLLFIDEKSMTGQKIFTMVSKRLQETRPRYKDKSIGNLSVVPFGDFKQLPPVCDALLFNANTVIPSGYNLYQVFQRPSPSLNLCDSNGQTEHTSGPN